MSIETFDEYRQRLLSYLGDQNPTLVLQTTSDQLDIFLNDITADTLNLQPQPGKWSIIEIVGHLADAELAFGWRVRNMLATPGVSLPWWNEELWSEKLFYQKRSLCNALSMFRAMRLCNLELLQLFTHQQWKESYGIHDVRGRQNVEEFVVMEAAHDLNHLLQIKRIISESPF
jgi:hypothetical protein